MPESFSENQWQRLVDAGPQIALAVAAASGSPAGSEVELEAFLRLLDQTADESDGGGSLGRLAVDARAKVAAGMLRGDPEVAMADGIQAAREAGAILAVHADEHEARVVRQWLLQVAHTVAGAAREGGLLGLGGEQVSKVERETMEEIADALGASGSEDEADESAEAQTTEEREGNGDDVAADGQPVGPDNIAEGRVRGTMGGPNQSEGQGQGG